MSNSGNLTHMEKSMLNYARIEENYPKVSGRNSKRLENIGRPIKSYEHESQVKV